MEIMHDVSIQYGKFDNNQNYLLNVWWNLTGHPDVIFHQATMVHDVKTINSSMESKYYKSLFKKMSNYVKQQNSVYFWSNSPRVYENKVPKKFSNWTKNANLHLLNKISFRELLRLQTNSSKSRLNFGLDLNRLSENLPSDAYVDAVHHANQWYNIVAGKLLSMYCVWLGY